LVSFVAGLSVKRIRETVGLKNIVRIMPNILINVKESATGIFAKNIEKSVKKKLVSDFEFFGLLKWLRFEDDINFFTALYGGGPAYVCYFLQCLVEISMKNGLSRDVSKKMVSSLIKGTSKILEDQNNDFETLIKKVASKGGTTEQALKILNNEKIFYKIINEAVLVAKKRSIEISKSLNSIKI